MSERSPKEIAEEYKKIRCESAKYGECSAYGEDCSKCEQLRDEYFEAALAAERQKVEEWKEVARAEEMLFRCMEEDKNKAEDKIAALEAELAEAKNHDLNNVLNADLQVKELTAENERLRAALEPFANWNWETSPMASMFWIERGNKAKEALGSPQAPQEPAKTLIFYCQGEDCSNVAEAHYCEDCLPPVPKTPPPEGKGHPYVYVGIEYFKLIEAVIEAARKDREAFHKPGRMGPCECGICHSLDALDRAKAQGGAE